MLKKRITALLCTAALFLALCGTSALADEQAGSELPDESTEAAQPDPEGTVTFGNLPGRMRESNLNYLILEQNVGKIEAMDYKKLEDDLRDQLNDISDLRWQMLANPMALLCPCAYNQLGDAYDSLRETFDNLRNGKIQADSADAVRQLRSAQNQVLMGGDALYIALAGLEITDGSLDRSLESLDRTIAELELRYGMGQISLLTLQTAKNSRMSLVSSQGTLDMNIQNLKFQLEQMIGAEANGSIQLLALPEVTAEQLSAMDLETGLAAAKEASYSLYAAKKTLDDAEDTYKDAGREHNYNEKEYQFVQAQHDWQAAQYTYQSTVQAFELGFRQLYSQVGDYKQTLDAARTALELKQTEYAASQLKYELGRISKNALLTAQDDVAAAQETVDSALIDLFSAYNTYCWAVNSGIVN